uniref:Secreted peptide n=1 Tax=Triticum urartu TaxID=4572 RepID=A0A8R7TEC0_TRIUA
MVLPAYMCVFMLLYICVCCPCLMISLLSCHPPQCSASIHPVVPPRIFVVHVL